ncbi:hypothetical protein FOH38_07990 [Lysinibacillus fusiformis]|nr:hypothetical protein FOH38_07990 [Lysinibacillus fusiformis]
MKVSSVHLCITIISFIMIYSGFSKVINIYEFINNLYYYKHIPESLFLIIGYGIPIIEIFIGVAIWVPNVRSKIIIGYQLLIGSFMVLFIVHFGSFMPQGCGCFGSSQGETISFLTILRESLFFLPAWIYFFLVQSEKYRKHMLKI